MRLSNTKKGFAIGAAILGASALVGAITFAVLTLVHLSPGSSRSAASCLDQVRGWSRSSVGAETTMSTDTGILESDLNSVAADAKAGNVTALHTDAGTLQADIGTWQSDLVALGTNLPPACAVSLHRSYQGAIQDYTASSGLLGQGASLILRGQYPTAAGQFQQATISIDQGNALFDTALADLQSGTGQG